MDDPRALEIFLDVQRGLPRQGPGSDGASRRALSYCTELPVCPQVLDIGCGPGNQTLVLAEALSGPVTALDLHGEYLAELENKATVRDLAGRVKTVLGDMARLPFCFGAFDLIWSEGAAYIIGVDTAVQEWQRFLRPDGYLVFSELVWLTESPPDEAVVFFAEEYPQMSGVPRNLEMVAEAGLELVGHFGIEDAGWWDEYYSPLEAKLPALRKRYRDDDLALSIIAMARSEIELRREHGWSFGYEFFIARKPA